MPVVIPRPLRRPTFRGAWIATIAEEILPDGTLDGVYVRLVLYCGDIDDEPFAGQEGERRFGERVRKLATILSEAVKNHL